MKYSVRFDLKAKPAAQGGDTRCRIRIRVSWAGRRAEALTGFQAPAGYWDAEGQRVRPEYRHCGETGASVNRGLAAATSVVDGLFDRCRVEGRTPSVREVRSALSAHFGTGAADTGGRSLFEIYDTFVSTMGEQNGWSLSTVKKFRTIRRHLHDFAPRLEFADLDEDGLQRFMRHLMKAGLRNVTVAKDINILRWFLRWAYRHGHTSENAFETFRPKLKGTDGSLKEVIYLEWDELLTLFHYDFGNLRSLARVRDVFCFCCFTGLRYSDAARLRVSDIRDGRVCIVTQKTSEGLRIELNDFSRAILERCRSFQESEGNRERLALPAISNQKMNSFLKRIGRMAGIDTPIRIVYYAGSERRESVRPKHELLTTHCARRTFVVNALRLGIPAEVIMKWTGHSDYAAMKPYVKIIDELREREMSKFNLLSGEPHPEKSPESPRKSDVAFCSNLFNDV